ncbi:hypothetical protein [Corynebacterium liangguodongii]|uniref:Uncharacterized protein n=1 Tax=Corynebacterium liangguodongii TaxID=2079535 RepID=A0A2S0WDK8_9CORY|nr:hypothetical protein [Corynebacterium liangguodongii]AWB83752.1 hypothetical protein C3E79_04005 [Corynebacterium liangguodongii]PWB99438.1 hypothetical protein DF219_05790 [Corynebacterium liangguodongii]
MKKTTLVGTILAATIALLSPAPAQATPTIAEASALTVAEDGGSEGYIGLTLTGDGAFAVSADRLRITTGDGQAVAVASTLTERDPETNMRLREITGSEVISAGETLSLRFAFHGSRHLDDASNRIALTDADGHTVTSWAIR